MATWEGIKLSEECKERLTKSFLTLQQAFKLLTCSAKEVTNAFLAFSKVGIRMRKRRNKLKLPLDKIVAYKKRG